MKILMLSCQFMPDVYGGAEKQCQRISSALFKQGMNITILTSRKNRTTKSSEVTDGVNIRRLYSPIAPDLLGRWSLFSLIWLFQVIAWTFIHRNEIDIIHCHQGKFGGFVGCLIGRILNKKVMIKVGNSNKHMDFKALQAKKIIGPMFIKFIKGSNPLIIAITSVIEKNCRDFGFENVVPIPNCVTENLINNFELDSPYQKPTDDSYNLFYHGRIEDIKKVDVLIQAFTILVCSKPEQSFKLNIIGGGRELPKVKDHAKALNLESAVTFWGPVDDPISLISKFDIFVNASEAEGFSNSLLEALLIGKVLVSTPVSGAKEAIHCGKNGFISETFSAESLADSMVRSIDFHDNESDSVPSFSSELVKSTFIDTKIAKEYLKVYRILVGDNK